ncbi:ABC transporter permease [candidate division KSB1 bacterium]
MKENKTSHKLSSMSEYLIKKIFKDKGETRLGDFIEVYNNLVEKKGLLKAKLWFWLYILRSVPELLKSLFFWRAYMFKNYSKIAIRNIKRQKFFSIINISGLALGMAAFMLMLLWIRDELSFDNFHTKKNNIYRIITEQNNSGEIQRSVASPNTLGEKLKNEYPEIIDYAMLGATRDMIHIEYKGKVFNKNFGTCASQSFFDMFSYTFLKGDPNTALQDPNSIVLTEELAHKIFGEEDPFGKNLNIFTRTVTVSGVIKNLPGNSHFKFDHIMPRLFWGNSVNVRTYILMEEGSNEKLVSAKIRNLLNKTENRDNVKISLQPLKKIHLYSKNFVDDIYNYHIGDITYVYIYSLSAICVLLIACINFTNLSSARFSSRIKEIGLRKVIGAYRSDIMRQFFGESILFAYAAFLIAVLIVYLFLPEFNYLSSKQLSFDLLANRNVLPLLILIPLWTGLASGCYPAFLFSSLQPANSLKESSIFRMNSRLIIRKILVVIQFAAAITIIIVTIISYRQLSFMRNRDIGFNKEHVISFEMRSYGRNKNAIKNEFLKNPDVLYVSVGFPPEKHWTGVSNVSWEGKAADEQVTLYYVYVDDDFLNVLELEMAEGRFFSEDFPTDSSNFIINESAAKVMGLSSPVGKRFIWNNGYIGREGRIIGIIKDYNQESLHHKIKPAFFIKVPRYPYINVKIRPNNVDETLTYLKKVWTKFDGDSVPFTYYFLDEVIDNLYRSEKRTGLILKYFTGLVIFISCLGLFGLAAITAIQRKKEIAVRKVMGASILNVNIILTEEFLKLIVISTFISWPVAWLLVNKWLQSFAYRVTVNIFPFILAGTLAIVISLFSMMFQTVKAARKNPVDSLKYE